MTTTIQISSATITVAGDGFQIPEVNLIPQSVTAFQAKAALLHADLLDNVEAMMTNPATPRIVKLAWDEALNFERQSPTVAAMASTLGLTDAEVDSLFLYAAEVVS